MLGHSHALSGSVAGAALGRYGLHMGVIGSVELAVYGACFATLPDLDQCGSSIARSLGFMSEGFAWVVHKISGGHRHGTHSLIGITVFTALTWLACYYRHDPWGRGGLALLLALAFAAGLRAMRIGGHFADLIAITAAGAMAWEGWGLILVPIACALGCATHIAGDMLTVEGCPLAWPFTWRHQFLLPKPLRFETGHLAERFAVVPALWVALLACGWLAMRLPVPQHLIWGASGGRR